MNPAHLDPLTAPEHPRVGWSVVEHALLQRARLMQRVAQDVYGPHHLLQRGWIPAALAWGHSAWQPNLHQIQPLAQRWVGLLTVELGEDASGQCWVLRSSVGEGSIGVPTWVTEAPTLFSRWWAHWQSSWPVPSGERACGVILASDPVPERLSDGVTWCWATPDRLQVRGGRLHVQLAHGWHVAHALCGASDLDAQDPLESTPTQFQGIAGLHACIRQHTLSVLNMPGLGFLNEPAWSAFWPSLCQQWLGESLLLPSCASWWLGEESVLKEAQQQPIRGWLLPHDASRDWPSTARPMRVGHGDENEDRLAWLTVRSRPEGWTLQQQLHITRAWRVAICCGEGGPEGICHVQPLACQDTAGVA